MKEMVGGCCVCSDDRGWTENPLVYCDGQMCTVAVHQACYGIVTVPTGNWYCRKCESQERTARVMSLQRCELCPSKDGALKRTDNSGWAHVVCALYIPEVRFGNVTTMEPILLQQIPPERFNKVCYICEEGGKGARATIGACMQCNKSGCKQQFHVTCAQALGLLCEEAGNYLDNVKYCGYCQHHYSKLKKSGNVKTIPPYRPIPPENASDSSSPEKEPSEGWGKSTAKRKLSAAGKSQSAASAQGSTGVKGAAGVSPNASTGDVSLDDTNSSSNNISSAGAAGVVQGGPQALPINTAGIKTEPPVANVGKFPNPNFGEGVINQGENAFGNEVGKGSSKKRKSIKDENSGSANATNPNSIPDELSKKIKTETQQEGVLQPASVVVKVPVSSVAAAAAAVSSVTMGSTATPPSSASGRIVTTNSSSPGTTTGSIVVSVPLTVAAISTPPISTSNSTASPQPTTTVTPSSLSPSSNIVTDDPPSKRGRSQSSEKSDKGRSKRRGGGGGGGGAVANSAPKRGGRGSQATPPPTPPAQAPSSVATTPTVTTAISATASSTVVVTATSSSVTSATGANSPAPGGAPAAAQLAAAPARFQNGVNAPHMLGNQLNPSSTMAQKMSDTLNQELEAHSIFTNDNSNLSTNNLVGPQLHSRVIASVRSSNATPPAATTSIPTSGSTTASGSTASGGGLGWGAGGQGTVPQTLDQLLERQWEQGSQFLMEQAQHFDIASLLSCLHQLRAENLRLEEHVSTLLQRRDHLLAVNARLAIPLTQMNNVHPAAAAAASSVSQPVGQGVPDTSGRTAPAARVNSSYPQVPHPMENGLPPSPPTTGYRASPAQPSPSTISRHHSPGSSGYVSTTPGVVVPRGGHTVQSTGPSDTHRAPDSRRSNPQPGAPQQAPSYATMYQVSAQQQQQQMAMRREVVTDLHHQIPPASKPS